MNDTNNFNLIMISAMYENGGNVTHRFLDGHPALHVYPFESQLGNARCSDFLSSLFPFKYRYPDFPVSSDPDEDYELFFDEELKTFLRNRKVSKFRSADLVMDESERKAAILSTDAAHSHALAGVPSRNRGTSGRLATVRLFFMVRTDCRGFRQCALHFLMVGFLFLWPKSFVAHVVDAHACVFQPTPVGRR